MLKVAFNAVPLLSPLTGIGQYVRHLGHGLQGISEVELRLFYGSHWAEKLIPSLPPTVGRGLSAFRRYVPFAYEARNWVQRNRFEAGARKQTFDLYHEPNNLALPFDGPSVITVHDLSWVRYPEMHPIERVRAMDKYFEPGLRRATRIITDSAFVKQELVEVFGLRPEIITSVALGVEPLFQPVSADFAEPVLQVHGLTYGAYWLAVGTLEPRKNLQLALRAFLQLPQAKRQACPMVLVGMTGWKTGPLEQQLQPLIAAGEVRQFGYIGRADLALVMAGAKALIYPSVYEGFGLPPLEAMACRVPVVASDVSSIPEVVGDAGVLINPQDVDGLAIAMQRLLEDEDHRQALGAAALARSGSFSWARCAQETVAVYKAAVQ